MAELFGFRQLVLGVGPMKRGEVDLVDKEDAIEMIDFMLHDAGRHSFQFPLVKIAFAIHRFDFHEFRSLYISI